MKSIWNNTFYTAQPALSWVYRLDMTNYIKSLSSNEDFLKEQVTDLLSEAIISVSLGKRESEFAPVYYGGVESKVFTRAKTSDSFTIKFSENKYFDVTSIFEKLYNFENMNQNYPFSSNTEGNANNVKYNDNITEEQQYTNFNSRIIKIQIFDPNLLPDDSKWDPEGSPRSPVAEMEFYGCKIASLSDIEFSYESTEVINRDVTFFYNYMLFKKKKKGLIEQKIEQKMKKKG